MPDRRSIVLGGAALLVAAVPVAAMPAAFSSIAVDVGPLRQKGLGPYADRVRAVLGAALARAFAGRVGGAGPRLVVRIDAVSLRAYVGSDGGPFGFGGNATNNDYMEGEGLVVDGRGGVLARYPQLSVSPASSGGPWYVEGVEDRQLGALADHFAGWMRRKFD